MGNGIIRVGPNAACHWFVAEGHAPYPVLFNHAVRLRLTSPGLQAYRRVSDDMLHNAPLVSAKALVEEAGKQWFPCFISSHRPFHGSVPFGSFR